MTAPGPPDGTRLDPSGLVLDPAAYAAVRPGLRRRMIDVRAARRVRAGDLVVLAFENAQTLQYQVQEMLAVEGVTDPAIAAAELATYERLLPTPDSLTATLFLEHDDITTVREDLARVTGIQHAVLLQVGDDTTGTSAWTVPGVEILGPDEVGPTTVTHAVHFLRFTFDPPARAAFCDPSVPVTVVVEHPAYTADGPLAGAARAALVADLLGQAGRPGTSG